MIRRVMKRLVLAAMAVLTITLVTASPPAQAALVYYVRLDTSNNFSVRIPGHNTATPLFTPAATCNHGADGRLAMRCRFPVFPGYFHDGIKEVTIKPKSCFPTNKKVTFRIYGMVWDAGIDQWLVSYINLTRDGGTWNIPSDYGILGERGNFLDVDFIVTDGYQLKKECLEYIELKKWL